MSVLTDVERRRYGMPPSPGDGPIRIEVPRPDPRRTDPALSWRRAMLAVRGVHLRRAVIAASAPHDHSCAACGPAPTPKRPPLPAWTDRQRRILASAWQSWNVEDLSAEVADTAAQHRRALDALFKATLPLEWTKRQLWARVFPEVAS